MEIKRCKITALSPVHIGSKEEITPYEFVVMDDILYVINLHALYANKRWGQYLPYGTGELRIVRESLNRVVKEITKMGELEDFVYWKSKISSKAKTVFDDLDRFKGIDLLPRAGKPYIPGSSVKGVLRTCVLNSLVEGFIPNESSKRNCKKWYYDPKRKNKHRPEMVEACILDAIENDKYKFFLDLFQYFYVGDSSPVEETAIINFIESMPSNHSRKSKLNLPVEVIPEMSSVEIEIRFDWDRYVKVRKRKNKKEIISKMTIDDVLLMSSKWTQELIEKELKRIDKISLDNNQRVRVKDFYTELKQLDLGEDKFLLRLGRFKSRHFNLIEKYSKEIKRYRDTKTLVLTETGRPLGWVVLEEL